FVQGMYDAVERARLADILFIAAAGNSSVDNDVAKFYPSSMTNENIISVAAITSTDGLASFSCYGDTSVDLGAPGSGIYSTLPGANYTYTYGSYSGTSMATPHVAGAAALYKSLNPGATFTQVKSALMSNARSISSLQGKTVTGGTLDVSFMSGGTVSETPADRACVPPPIDYTPPTVPAQVRTTSITNSSLAVAWDASSDPESGVALYYAYLRWPTGTTSIISTTGTSGTFSNLGPGINYKLYVAAKNGYGLWSSVSDTLFVTTTGTPDAQAPTVPTNFKASGATTTSLSFSWTASTDNVGVSGYQIRWRKAGNTGYSSASFSGTSVTISGLLAATNYEISLRAYDASQNYSAYTTPDLFVGTVGSYLVAPTTPNNLAVT
ncbi:MAG: S8 family serine peptidase, partial [Chitinophagaceae bacterium]